MTNNPQLSESRKQARENGAKIIEIARRYGMNELDLLQAMDEVNQLPKIFPSQEGDWEERLRKTVNGMYKPLNKDLEKMEEEPYLDPDGVYDELKQIIQYAMEKRQQNIFKLIEPIFNEWANNSNYITGSWCNGEYVDSDKKSKFWDNLRRTAWEQFAYILNSRLAGTDLDSTK